MNARHYTQSGFSAVELLITLFIAAAFIATGAQLYSVVIKNSDDARMRSKASNIAYENLQKYAVQATNPCTASNPSASIPANSGLPAGATMTVNITCPYASSPTSKINISVKYNTPQEEVIHALFVNK